MSKRDTYLQLVDNRDCDTVIFAPLTDNLYAASFAGKKWVSDSTLEDQIEAAQTIGYYPSFVCGNRPYFNPNPGLTGLVETRCIVDNDTERRFVHTIHTPKGDITTHSVERPEEGITGLGDWFTPESDLTIANWISEDILAGNRDQLIRDYYGDFVKKTRSFGVTQMQVEIPYFLYTLPGLAVGPLMMALDENSGYADSMALAEEALKHIATILIEVGIDFIWIGASGTELLSPDVWERIVIPQSQRMVEHVHAKGGRIHFHCCGQSQLWIEKGYFDRIQMDVLETLSAPPAGTVADIGHARSLISKNIVTRGNIDLGLIRTGTPSQCAAAARQVIDATRGYPHLVGAGDAILYGTPPENLIAICEECQRTAD